MKTNVFFAPKEKFIQYIYALNINSCWQEMINYSDPLSGSIILYFWLSKKTENVAEKGSGVVVTFKINLLLSLEIYNSKLNISKVSFRLFCPVFLSMLADV